MEDNIIGTKIKPTNKETKEIGIDTTDSFTDEIVDAAEASQLDLGVLESFSTVAQTREQIYTLIDTMSQDETISAILETYAEDTVEPNDSGRIVWCESGDEKITKYITYLLDSINVEKNIYAWTYNLIKYGDLYLKLYRESDYDNDILFGNDKDVLNEDIKVNINSKNDHYVHYVEMVANPGEMFELTRFGKSVGYIKAPATVQQTFDNTNILNQYLTYKMKKNDVSVYNATDFVHACIQNNVSRNPEEVKIFMTDEDLENDNVSTTYTVRKGQSILYNSFKIWRELALLENSVLLNRLTKSAIVRILNIDVGDMPKEQVNTFIQRLKSKIEQKSALNIDKSMTEYTNPGPIENVIYIPTHGQQGSIQANTLGGDVDVKSLIDLDWFQNKLFGSLRVPKQYFCLRGNTLIPLLNGEYVTIKEMFDNKNLYLGKGILTCGKEGKVESTKIKNIMLTKEHSNFVRIYLDNNEFIDVTPEHRIMMRNGEFKEAKDIVENDLVMGYKENNSIDTVVVKVEYLNIDEPAYDIEVESSNHTFALKSGVFVHNCQTEDSTGFNGGTSLTIISSRYGKQIKMTQNIMCQVLTDLINLFLIDKKLTSYINKFTLRMQPPITQEEIDKRENMRNRLGVIGDIMNQINEVVTDDILKAKIIKILLSDSNTNSDVITLIQDQIDQMELDKNNKEKNPKDKSNKDEEDSDISRFNKEDEFNEPRRTSPIGSEEEPTEDEFNETEMEENPEGEESYLPSPSELEQDFVNLNSEEI